MFTKYKIEGLDGYVFGEDKNLYRLPFERNGRGYGVREIRKQYPNRYRINGVWWSHRQLRSKIYKDPNPSQLFLTDDMPF